jgi:DNA-binding NarL/FixJ family response regulator
VNTNDRRRCESRCLVQIVSRSQLFAQALACLAGSGGIEARTEAADASGGHPDVVLLDSDMPAENVIAQSAQLQAQYPSARLVLLVKSAGPQFDALVPQVGAVGLLTRDVGRSGLVNAAAGRSIALSTRLPDPSYSVNALTMRERSVLRLLGTGLSNGEIAAALDISPNTVRTHVQNILSKLGTNSRHNAVTMARQAGLICEPLPSSSLCS